MSVLYFYGLRLCRLNAYLLLLLSTLVAPKVDAEPEITNGLRDKTLSLPNVTAAVLANDLTLSRLGLEANAFTAEAEASSYLPDPVLFGGLQNLPSDTFDLDQEPMTQFRFGIRQMLPKGDSLEINQKMSTISTGMQGLKQQIRRSKLKKASELAWLEAWYWQKKLELIAEDRVFLVQVLDFVQSLYEVGSRPQSDVLGAQLELIKLDESRIEAEQKYHLYRSELNTLANSVLEGSLLNPDLYLFSSSLARKLRPTELADILTLHPELQLLDAQISMSEQRQSMTEQNFEPTWGLEVAYGLRTGEDMTGNSRSDFLSAGVSVSLPLFTDGKQKSELNAAKFRNASIENQRLETLQKIRFQLESMQQQVSITQQQRTLYEQEFLPKLAEQKQSALRSYESDSGNFGIVTELFRKEQSAKTEHQRLRVKEQILLSAINYWLAEQGDEAQ